MNFTSSRQIWSLLLSGSAAVVMGVCSGCASSGPVLKLSLVSNQLVVTDAKNSAPAEGKSCMPIIFGFPIGAHDSNDLVQRAVEKAVASQAGANTLQNAELITDGIMLPPFYMRSCIIAKGYPVTIPDGVQGPDPASAPPPVAPSAP